MKKKVNSNFIWADTFIKQLSEMGVKYACISPGSRSTPLTYSIAINKKIRHFVNIDERSSAFFALGLAKATNNPVIIVTTSGTATAELYPAIIEAYQQRVPLIICTADRPPELVGTGANQTINQHNLYRNHIRWFRDVGLPNVKEHSLRYLQKVAVKAFKISLINDRGPVHINFPFKKPLEPFSFNEEVFERIINLKPINHKKNGQQKNSGRDEIKKVKRIAERVIGCERGLIIAGPADHNPDLVKKIKTLSSLTKYPVLADGGSHLRFSASKSDKNLISNYHSILGSVKFRDKYAAELIIHFGRTPASSNLLDYLAESTAERYQVNEYGDLYDPSRNTRLILNITGEFFSETFIDLLKKEKFTRRKSKWLEDFKTAEGIAWRVVSEELNAQIKLTEPKIVTELLKYLPSKSHLFLGNSLPIRDFDCFSGISSKLFNLYFNRGASGIDGIVSTALGVAAVKRPVFLLVGDISFLHDLNSLSIAIKNRIPLTVILINNNGGGIFRALPVSRKKKLLNEFFTAPHNLNIADIVKAFGIRYKSIKNKTELRNAIEGNKLNSPVVLEIQTNAIESAKLRKRLFNRIKVEIDKSLT